MVPDIHAKFHNQPFIMRRAIWRHVRGHTDTHTNKPPRAGVQTSWPYQYKEHTYFLNAAGDIILYGAKYDFSWACPMKTHSVRVLNYSGIVIRPLCEQKIKISCIRLSHLLILFALQNEPKCKNNNIVGHTSLDDQSTICKSIKSARYTQRILCDGLIVTESIRESSNLTVLHTQTGYTLKPCTRRFQVVA